MASRGYQKCGELLGTKGLDFVNDTIGVLFVTDAYVFDIGHANVSDVVANEVPGTTRANAGSKTWTWNAANSRWEFKHANTSHGSPAVGQTLGAAILFLNTGVDATSSLLFFDDGQSNIPTTGQPVTYVPPADGHQVVHV